MLIPAPIPFRRDRGRPLRRPPQPTPPPVGGAVAIDAFLTEGGETCTLVFDRPVAIQGPFNFADGSIQFSDHDPVAVSVIDPNSL